MAEHVLMIEDDAPLASMVAEYLGGMGLQVTTAHNAAAGLKHLGRRGFDALILDIMLPDMDGFEVCRRVRAQSDIPILMLTARGDETDRIVGLELERTTISPSPSTRGSCWPACAPSCGAAVPRPGSALPFFASASWRSTATAGPCA